MADLRFSGAARHADDTRRRFLADIADRVPLDRLVEVHLFTPIRQGGAETGVAVVVAQRVEPEIAPNEASPVDEAASPSERGAEAWDPTDDAAGPVDGADATADGPPNEAAADDAVDAPDEAPAEAPAEAPRRHTIFTARYRLALRGPERGRWTVDVVEEADAPLITVAAVVRGVRRRAGDEAEPDRLDSSAVATSIGATVRAAAADLPPDAS